MRIDLLLCVMSLFCVGHHVSESLRLCPERAALSQELLPVCHIPCCLSPVPTMPLLPVIGSGPRLRAFAKSTSALPSAPGSDQRCFSRSLVMRRAEPLGASYIPRLPLQENSTTSPIKPASSSYTQTWNSHLTSTRLPSHSAPRVPEEAAERQRRIVS